jgi:hypothetical protein
LVADSIDDVFIGLMVASAKFINEDGNKNWIKLRSNHSNKFTSF